MSVDLRINALTAATLVAEKGALTEDVLKSARGFLAFLEGGETSPAPSKPAPAAAPRKPGRPKKTEEETVNQAIADATDAAEAEAEAEAEGAEAAEEEAPADPLKAVQDVIALALAKNKRAEVVKVLKKYNAASAKGVKAADRLKFIAEVNKIIGPAAEEDDLTA